MKCLRTFALLLGASFLFNQAAAQIQLAVQADRSTTPVQPTMWGVFFEDINFGADGGIYAELIKNRSFEFAQPLMGWTLQENNRFSLNKESGNVLVINRTSEIASNPHVARVSVSSDKDFVMTNEGFRGLGIKDGNTYYFSIWARQEEGAGSTVSMSVVSPQGNVLGSCSVNISGGEWKKYTGSFIAKGTEPKASPA